MIHFVKDVLYKQNLYMHTFLITSSLILVITRFPEPYFWNQMQEAEANVLNAVQYPQDVDVSPRKE